MNPVSYLYFKTSQFRLVFAYHKEILNGFSWEPSPDDTIGTSSSIVSPRVGGVASSEQAV